nr:BCCT family transporter [Salinicoccus halodurans]
MVLTASKSAATITALPFGIIMIFMMVSLYKSLKEAARENQKIKEEEDW